MLQVEINLPPHLPSNSIPGLVEEACSSLNLDRATRGTLAKYPGSIHWHYKNGKARGTLEITWWARERRLWIKVAAGRRADWIDALIPRLKRTLEAYNRPKSSHVRKRQKPLNTKDTKDTKDSKDKP